MNTFWVLLIFMVYACGPPCEAVFSNPRGLTNHRIKCAVFTHAKAHAAMLHTKVLEKKKAKRIARKISARASLLGPTLNASDVHPFQRIFARILILLVKHASMPLASVSLAPEIMVVDDDTRESYVTDRQPEPDSSQPAMNQTGRPQRCIRRPRRYDDVQPELPAQLPQHLPGATGHPLVRRVTLIVRDAVRTAANSFGLIREYMYRPSHDPESHMAPELLANPVLAAQKKAKKKAENLADRPPPPWPFKNMSIYRLLSWGNTGSNQKSIVEMQRLVDDVITAPDFRPEHVAGCKIRQEYKKLDHADASRTSSPFSQGDWQQATVTIDVPTGTRNASGNGKPFTVPGLQYRSLKAVIISAFSSPMSCLFHFSPFKRLCRGERVYDELYTSDAWIQENDKLQRQTNEPGCKLEKVIASLMFWSDSTHLANFGTAKVWPLYLYFGNLSKYLRAMPNADACHHVAYIPSVSSPHNY